MSQASEQQSGLLYRGNEPAGCYVRSTLANGGAVALRETDIADTALSFSQGVQLPRLQEVLPIPLTPIANLGKCGIYHRNIGSEKESGPFKIVARTQQSPSYPVLWAHEASEDSIQERHLVVEPDSEGRIRTGNRERALSIWETATRLHFNLDFRLNSQSLAACLTPERAIGGRAWPNFRLSDPDAEEAIALWANTTLGLVAFWWAGSRQHEGRSILTIKTLPSLLALDVRQLSPSQLAHAKAIFDRFRSREFLPANEAYRDETRQALDRAVLTELLGVPETALDPLGVLRLQWCSEPTVHGGQDTRPDPV